MNCTNENCPAYAKCLASYRGSTCKATRATYGLGDPMTNAEKIRQMTDEELDKFLGEVQWDVANYCGGVTEKQEYPVPEQMGAWLDWLKATVEVQDGT